MCNTIEFEGNQISLGDIFVSIWGYEQTNVHFYQVVGVAGKSTVKLREVESREVPDHKDAYSGEKYAKPDYFKNNDILTRRLVKGCTKPTVKDDHARMRKIDPLKGYSYSTGA
ncbi:MULTISPECIES: hypothetical protein [Enterobacteriaceae]|uniref:hypothetical protein n=1 Tax=Enterobacteriaceae TaxID=543 RepID=UPI000D6E971F|nr:MULTISPECIES: hypothetical protein [Enterobacteriaceae]EAT0477748.1 hypothetical protein [Salmonella enterica]EBG8282891.1 hypothetical protein [Salmonella enterica subsp. enterica serovar Muenchen]EBX4631085.1 hypothetical protein [Salmonella enterica subsp. enterica serovar Infantis]ECE8410923.1 hypothetical protein [Salmonella enterica subsp. enterica serovar Anatum]ECU4356175.1 hypothetical protein [Salmonella enterica subsp. enterica serovar Braenderup]EDM7166783.1 hypothetical protei